MRTMVLVLILCLSAQTCWRAEAQTNRISPIDLAQAMNLLDNQQKLGPGDRVTYRVIEDQDDPRSLTITGAGELDVPYLGLVRATGKTSRELAYDIKPLLEQKLYFHATVIIAVELIEKTPVGKVYVTGQVRNQGGYDIPRTEMLTVSKAILAAGGFSDFSDKKNVKLLRKTPQGQPTTFTVNVEQIWKKSKLQEDLPVQAGDTIIVPTRFIN